MHAAQHAHKAKSKAYMSCAKHNDYHPVNQDWDVYAPLRYLKTVQANLPRAELVTCRRSHRYGNLITTPMPFEARLAFVFLV